MEHSVRPTIKLIAEKAGVSTMTVSRILRNYPNHSPKTRERVLRVAAELDYRKNPLVSALMANLRHKKPIHFRASIALVHCSQTSNSSNPARSSFHSGVEAAASANGYTVESFHINESGMTPDRLLRVIHARGFRCLIFEQFRNANVKLDLNMDDFAGVSITNTLVRPKLNRVEPDHYAGFILAVEKLKEMGYQKYGFIPETDGESSYDTRRLAAHLLTEKKLRPEERIPQLWSEGDESSMKEKLIPWLNQWKPEVILSADSKIPAYLMELGYKIPEDIGFIHLGLCDAGESLSGINPNWYDVGVTAASQAMELLVNNKYGEPDHPKSTFTDPFWVDGPSLKRRIRYSRVS